MTRALPFLEWIGEEIRGSIYISQVQMITLDQFITACVIFDEALKWSSSDDTHTNPWNFLGRFEVFFFFLFFFSRMHIADLENPLSINQRSDQVHSRHVNELKQIIHTGPSSML